jgi:integrase
MARALGHIPEDRAKRLTRGHHKALPNADVPALMARLVETTGVAAKALQFLILTATRSGEALGAQWDEISFQTETWVIPSSRMKMGEAFSVPLSDAALRLLADQMGQRGKSVYVFPGLPKKPLSSMAMSMLLRRMGESVTVHGFRTSSRGAATSPMSSSRSRNPHCRISSATPRRGPTTEQTCWKDAGQL